MTQSHQQADWRSAYQRFCSASPNDHENDAELTTLAQTIAVLGPLESARRLASNASLDRAQAIYWPELKRLGKPISEADLNRIVRGAEDLCGVYSEACDADGPLSQIGELTDRASTIRARSAAGLKAKALIAHYWIDRYVEKEASEYQACMSLFGDVLALEDETSALRDPSASSADLGNLWALQTALEAKINAAGVDDDPRMKDLDALEDRILTAAPKSLADCVAKLQCASLLFARSRRIDNAEQGCVQQVVAFLAEAAR